MLRVLTSKKEYKLITISDFKRLEIDFTGWYCPINNYIFMIDMDGRIQSGVCTENIHCTKANPWWNLKELVLNTSNNNMCTFKRGNCFCASDIRIHKAIDKDIYDWFKNNWPDENADLSFATTDDKIISVGTPETECQEVHFHIGKRCNFDCSYCPPWVHNNFSPNTPLEKFKQILDLIEPHVHYKDRARRKLFITGGEPTLNPLLSEMIHYGNKLNYLIKVNTNGTASLTKLTELASLNVHLMITFHSGLSNKKLMEKIGKLVLIPNIQVLIKVMAKEDSEFSQLVRSYMPDKPGGQAIEYNPIYRRYPEIPGKKQL